jgi:hypothetical protein
MARHSTAMTAFLDVAHRAHFDPEAGVVTFTAHGSGDDVVPVTGPMDQVRLRAMVRAHEFGCCDWPTLLDLARNP